MDAASNDVFATSPSLINTYQRYWTGAVVWLESILKQIGISQDLVDLTVMPQHTSEHCCYSAMLVVKTNLLRHARSEDQPHHTLPRRDRHRPLHR